LPIYIFRLENKLPGYDDSKKNQPMANAKHRHKNKRG
jgi:hypothetical protein